MDSSTEKESDFIIDLESGIRTSNLEEMATNLNGFADGFVIIENGATLIGNITTTVNKEVEGDNNTIDPIDKTRRKTLSAKKPPRPPRPLSLDPSDQKIIRELAELAMMKRARIERMKALKKTKVSKGSASYGNLIAMIFTIIFCLAIIFQGGCHEKSSAVRFQGSPESAKTSNSRLILLHHRMNTPTRFATDARFVEKTSASPMDNNASKSS